MSEQDTFCGELAQVTCASCPMRLLREEQFAADMQEGITPFQAADAICSELDKAQVDAEDMLAAESADGEEGPGDADIDLRAVIGRAVTNEAIAALERTTVRPMPGVWGDPDEVTHPPVTETFKMCLGRRLAKTCELTAAPEPAEAVLPIRVDRSFGADTLETLARHGSDDDVYDMVNRIGAALAGRDPAKDNKGEITFADLMEHEGDLRSFLLTFANSLRPKPE